MLITLILKIWMLQIQFSPRLETGMGPLFHNHLSDADSSCHWHNAHIFWRFLWMVFWSFKKSIPISVDRVLLVNDFELMPKESFDYKLGYLVLNLDPFHAVWTRVMFWKVCKVAHLGKHNGLKIHYVSFPLLDAGIKR